MVQTETVVQSQFVEIIFKKANHFIIYLPTLYIFYIYIFCSIRLTNYKCKYILPPKEYNLFESLEKVKSFTAPFILKRVIHSLLLAVNK